MKKKDWQYGRDRNQSECSYATFGLRSPEVCQTPINRPKFLALQNSCVNTKWKKKKKTEQHCTTHPERLSLFPDKQNHSGYTHIPMAAQQPMPRERSSTICEPLERSSERLSTLSTTRKGMRQKRRPSSTPEKETRKIWAMNWNDRLNTTIVSSTWCRRYFGSYSFPRSACRIPRNLAVRDCVHDGCYGMV